MSDNKEGVLGANVMVAVNGAEAGLPGRVWGHEGDERTACREEQVTENQCLCPSIFPSLSHPHSSHHVIFSFLVFFAQTHNAISQRIDVLLSVLKVLPWLSPSGTSSSGSLVSAQEERRHRRERETSRSEAT